MLRLDSPQPAEEALVIDRKTTCNPQPHFVLNDNIAQNQLKNSL